VRIGELEACRRGAVAPGCFSQIETEVSDAGDTVATTPESMTIPAPVLPEVRASPVMTGLKNPEMWPGQEAETTG